MECFLKVRRFRLAGAAIEGRRAGLLGSAAAQTRGLALSVPVLRAVRRGWMTWTAKAARRTASGGPEARAYLRHQGLKGKPGGRPPGEAAFGYNPPPTRFFQ